MKTNNYTIAQLDGIPAVPCPCGQARRAFGDEPEQLATLHLVDIKTDARTHYHKRMTEIYVVLEGEGDRDEYAHSQHPNPRFRPGRRVVRLVLVHVLSKERRTPIRRFP